MSQFKKKLTAFTAMLTFLSLSSVATFANPDLGSNPIGNGVGINNSNGVFNINNTTNQNGSFVQQDWHTFNVDKNEHVNFGFSGTSQTILNRVLGGQESSILGKLTNSCIDGGSCTSFASTSRVILINPAGMMFGPGSTVDLNSFTASTHDMVGAKNIKGMSEADLKAYQANVLDKLSSDKSVNGTNYNFSDIKFDSNYTEAFEQAGVQYDKDATRIQLNGTTFAHFNPDGSIASFNPNKTVNILSDNIDYKDSLIKTGTNFNYRDDSSYSNVRLVTADGVTFGYTINGYSDQYSVNEDSKNDVTRNININNSGKGAAEVGIESGSVDIINKTNAAGSDIKISNAVIKANKLVNTSTGDIKIVSSHDIELDKARLETDNSNFTKDGKTYSTLTQKGGEVLLSAGDNVSIKDSHITTANVNIPNNEQDKSSFVRIFAGKKASIDNTNIIAKGDAIVDASKVDVNESLIQASNRNYTGENSVQLSGSDEVKVHNSIITADKNIEIKSTDSNNATSGNIIISSDLDANGKNQTLLSADEKISLQGESTTLDNALLSYQQISFYNDGTTGTNNVRVANNTQFTPIKYVDGSKKIQNDINLETNGNLTFDNATAQRASYSLKFVNDADGNLVDDMTPTDAISYTLNIKGTADAVNLNATSTQGDVVIKNNSNLVASNDINLTANQGNVHSIANQQPAGSLKAGNDINIKAGKDVQLWNSISLEAQNDVNIEGTNIYNGDTQFNKKTNIKAGRDVNVKASNAVVNATNTEAGQDINISGKTVKSVKGDTLTANRDINITSAEDTEIKTSKLSAKNNINVTAGKDAHIAAELKADKNVNIKAAKNVGIIKSQPAYDQAIANIEAGENVNVEATGGELNIGNNTKILAGKDVSLKSYETITFGPQGAPNINIDNSSSIIAGEDMYITSTNGDINGEKTTMPELTYGDRLTFNAKGDNTFTSEDSLKSVNVDYIAGGANKFYTKDDIQFVNSSLKAPTNFVESGKDVILNNLTIKQATTNAKDTVTEIYANGNVTTDDVTGTAAADASAATKKFPQSVSTTKTGEGKTVLDINKTKLKITTETVKDANNPNNGSITLDVKNADNKDAGLELVAQNVEKLDKDPTGGNFKTGYYKSGTQKWDQKIEQGEGPEVHLNATDNKVAISKIITDKLTLDKNDKLFASDVELTEEQKAGFPEGTPSKGYIEVRDQGGFNLDDSTGYDPKPDGFDYTGNYDSTSTIVDQDVVKDVQETVTQKVEENGNQTITTTTTTTETTTTTTTTTETNDKKHTIQFDNDGNPSDFILVYDKTTVDTKVDVQKDVTTNDVVDITTNCPETPDNDRRPEADVDSFINQIKLPREQVEISKTSKVSDNTVDQTSSVMSAAAKVDLSEGANASYTNETQSDAGQATTSTYTNNASSDLTQEATKPSSKNKNKGEEIE